MSAHDPVITVIIDGILEAEGSRYTAHPADRGGPTKFGVTQATLAAYRGHPVTPEDVAALDETTARCIYRQMYVTTPGFHDIPGLPVRVFVIDCGVHHGVGTAARWLQTALGVTADGVVGPQTLAAARAADPVPLFQRLVARRIRHMGRLITKDPSQAAFAGGWMDRVAAFLDGQR